MTNSKQYEAQTLLKRLESVQTRVADAVARRDSEREVKLVAVSKTHPFEALRVLYDAGVRRFGASYVQEWEDKVEHLPSDIEWHFVGRLQSNKAKYIADRISMVHSVDRKSVAKKLNKRSQKPVDVLLQVNLDDQESKGGVVADKLFDLMDVIANYPRLRVRGLMGMPPYRDDPEENRPHFRTLATSLGRLQQYVADTYPERCDGLCELSMGMSNDFEVAIEEGATIIRLGTALFGKRDYDE